METLVVEPGAAGCVDPLPSLLPLCYVYCKPTPPMFHIKTVNDYIETELFSNGHQLEHIYLNDILHIIDEQRLEPSTVS